MRIRPGPTSRNGLVLLIFPMRVWYAINMRPSSIALILILLGMRTVASSEVWTISAEEWSRPRSGAALVQIPELHDAIVAWSEQPDTRLVIHYPGGEEGALWAHELMDWLVSLGVPARQINVSAGHSRSDTITINLQ